MAILSIVHLWPAILMAVVLDLLIGDPIWRYHPVRIIGRVADWLEPRLRGLSRHQKINGMIFNLIIVLGFSGLVWLIQICLGAWSPWLAWLFQVAIIYFCLALRSLTDEGRIVARYLKDQDVEAARHRVQMIVSRSLRQEDVRGIIRALLETLSENLSDGVIAPLLFALLGGAPLVMAYKAINTLDSMVGYKNERYRDFGWFSARLDDVANYIPARLTGILLVMSSILFREHPINAIRTWLRDAQRGPSPNGGIPITVFAGAHDVHLGGDCIAPDGSLIPLPEVGGTRKDLGLEDIHAVNRYIFASSFLLLGLYLVLIFFFVTFHN